MLITSYHAKVNKEESYSESKQNLQKNVMEFIYLQTQITGICEEMSLSILFAV